MIIHQDLFSDITYNEPTLYIIVKKTNATNDEFGSLSESIKKMYDVALGLKKKINIMYDFRILGMTQVNLYLKWANLFLEYSDKSKKCIHKAAVLVSNSIMLNLLNSFLGQNSNFSYKISSNEEEIMSFVKNKNYTPTIVS